MAGLALPVDTDSDTSIPYIRAVPEVPYLVYGASALSCSSFYLLSALADLSQSGPLCLVTPMGSQKLSGSS